MLLALETATATAVAIVMVMERRLGRPAHHRAIDDGDDDDTAAVRPHPRSSEWPLGGDNPLPT